MVCRCACFFFFFFCFFFFVFFLFCFVFLHYRIFSFRHMSTLNLAVSVRQSDTLLHTVRNV